MGTVSESSQVLSASGAEVRPYAAPVSGGTAATCSPARAAGDQSASAGASTRSARVRALNAVQHGEPQSAIQIRIHGGGTAILIEVANRGEPIPPAAMPHIFDAFRRGRTELASRTQGLGLGLFIAQ